MHPVSHPTRLLVTVLMAALLVAAAACVPPAEPDPTPDDVAAAVETPEPRPAETPAREPEVVTPEATPEPPPEPVDPGSLEGLMATFLDADGYTELDPTAVDDALVAGLEADPASALRPDSEIGPLAKPILVLESQEGVLQRVRYRLTYGEAQVDAPPAADPVTVSLVQVDRFNLAPAIRQELVEIHGEEQVAPLDSEQFGEGPHVSYRVVMRPIMGQAADIVGVARARISDEDADAMTCLGAPCTTTAPLGEDLAEWEDTGEVALGFDPAYAIERSGVLSPAAAIELIAVELALASDEGGRFWWTGFELREGVEPAEPFVEAMIEFGAGQDITLDAVLREGYVMDHEIEAVWQRLSSIATAPGEPPMTFAARAYDRRAGP